MYDVNQISDYIILKMSADEPSGLTHLKLQKLLYYVQAWHLAFHQKPIINSDFQAWVHGPVNRPTYDRFKNKGLYSFITPFDIGKSHAQELHIDVKNHIDSVLDVYAPFSSAQLEIMTHREDPWIDARKGYTEFQRCENFIDNRLIAEYYSKRLS